MATPPGAFHTLPPQPPPQTKTRSLVLGCGEGGSTPCWFVVGRGGWARVCRGGGVTTPLHQLGGAGKGARPLHCIPDSARKRARSEMSNAFFVNCPHPPFSSENIYCIQVRDMWHMHMVRRGLTALLRAGPGLWVSDAGEIHRLGSFFSSNDSPHSVPCQTGACVLDATWTQTSTCVADVVRRGARKPCSSSRRPCPAGPACRTEWQGCGRQGSPLECPPLKRQ